MFKFFPLGLSAAAIAVVAAIAGPSMAETVTVSKMTYKNNGAYDAYFFVRYNTDSGIKCGVYLENDNDSTGKLSSPVTIKTNNKLHVDLTSSKFLIFNGTHDCAPNGKIPNGKRVWGKIVIKGGDEQSCKKSVVLVKGSNGGRVDYRSGGTTLNNNRCKQSLP